MYRCVCEVGTDTWHAIMFEEARFISCTCTPSAGVICTAWSMFVRCTKCTKCQPCEQETKSVDCAANKPLCVHYKYARQNIYSIPISKKRHWNYWQHTSPSASNRIERSSSVKETKSGKWASTRQCPRVSGASSNHKKMGACMNVTSPRAHCYFVAVYTMKCLQWCTHAHVRTDIVEPIQHLYIHSTRIILCVCVYAV